MLRDFLPRQTYAVVAETLGELRAIVAGAFIQDDDRLILTFSRPAHFRPGQRLTVQLDNRIQVGQMSGDLPIYRSSVWCTVDEATPWTAEATPLHYRVFYSSRVLTESGDPGKRFEPDARPPLGLPDSPLAALASIDLELSSEPVGVLVTQGPVAAHTSVMAFLGTQDGELFLMSEPASRKIEYIRRDNRVVFAVDKRRTYDLNRPVDWSYQIAHYEVFGVGKNHALFGQVHQQFVRLKPWDALFFESPTIELFHLHPAELAFGLRGD